MSRPQFERGGADANALADAEIYDPVLDSWASAGTMRVPRAGHTATTLASGGVLVAGGCATAPCNPTNTSAELWDPVAHRFTMTSPMTVPRHDFRAARLANDTVIVMGGCGPTAACTRTTEVFDELTGQWSLGPDMSAERGFFAGATMPDGREIIIGGCNSDTCIPWTELLSRVQPRPDAGHPTSDASVGDAAPQEAGLPDTGHATTDAGTAYIRPACGCRTPGRRGSHGTWLLVALAVVASARRRRSERSQTGCRRWPSA